MDNYDLKKYIKEYYGVTWNNRIENFDMCTIDEKNGKSVFYLYITPLSKGYFI
jgi:hypothetical protein